MFPEEKKNKKNNDFKTAASNKIFRNIGTIATAAISFVWLFSGFFKIEFTPTSILSVVLGSLISIIVAISIKISMGIQAMKSAMETTTIVTLELEHKNTIDEVNKYVEYSDEWEDFENETAYSKARASILAQAGLKYSKFFNSEGEYIGELPKLSKEASKLEKEQHKRRSEALKRALTLRLTHITFAAVSTQSSINYDVHNFGKTPSEFQRNRVFKKSIAQILSAAMGAQITWGLAKGMNFWEALFTGAIQLSIFLVFGAMEYMSNWNYVTRDYKENLTKKINAAKRLKSFGEIKIKQRGETINGSFESE